MSTFPFSALALPALAAPRARAAPARPTAPVRVLFVDNGFLHGKHPPVLSYNAAGVTDENYG